MHNGLFECTAVDVRQSADESRRVAEQHLAVGCAVSLPVTARKSLPIRCRFQKKDRARMVCALMHRVFSNNRCIWQHLPTIARLVNRGDATLGGMWSFIRMNCNITRADLGQEMNNGTKIYLAALVVRRVRAPQARSPSPPLGVARMRPSDDDHVAALNVASGDEVRRDTPPCHACARYVSQVKCVGCLNVRFCAGCIRHTHCNECKVANDENM